MISFLKRRLQDASAIRSPARRRARILLLLSRRRARTLISHVGAAVGLICVVPLQSCGGQATEPSRPIYEVPAAIDPTGATDVTDQLLAFFATVPDGSIIAFPVNATYRIENTLLIQDRNSVTFEGNGSTILALTDGSGVAPDPSLVSTTPPWPLKRRHWSFRGGSNITLRDMTIRGAHPSAPSYVDTYEGQHGITFEGVHTAEVDNVTINDVYGDHILLAARSFSSPDWSSHIWIHNCTFARNGRQGIAIVGAQDVLIENNSFSEGTRAVLDLEADVGTGGGKRITFRRNSVGSSILNFLSNVGSGASVWEDITVENNTLTGKTMNMTVGSATMPFGFRRRYIIRNNTSDLQFARADAYMMNFFSIDNLRVTGNTAPLDPNNNVTGVRAAGSCGVVVNGNVFNGAAREAEIQPYPC